MKAKKLGILAEGIARLYLIKRGYKILTSNYQTKFGEVDVIAKKDDSIVFFEVKASKTDFDSNFKPELRVDFLKKRKLIKLAQIYLMNNNLTDVNWQIDIISVIFKKGDKVLLKHYRNI